MTDRNRHASFDDQIRESYREYSVGETRIATIADPHDDAAWIRSTVTSTVEP